MYYKMNFTPQNELLDTVLDAMPGQVLVVDKERKVHRMNVRARKALSSSKGQATNEKLGSILDCIYFDGSGDACTAGKGCETCLIKLIIEECTQKEELSQKKVRFIRSHKGKVSEHMLLVSAAPFQHENKTRVLLMIEDLSHLEPQNDLVSICAECKKIRDPEGKWEPFESYFGDRFGVDFSHAICSDCLKKLYPGFGKT